MLAESISIISILIVMSILFLRDKKIDYVKSAMILAIVPMANVLSIGLSHPLSRLKGIARGDVIVTGVIIGLILSSFLLGLMSIKIHKPRMKLAYLATTGLFTGILTILFLYNIGTLNL